MTPAWDDRGMFRKFEYPVPVLTVDVPSQPAQHRSVFWTGTTRSLAQAFSELSLVAARDGANEVIGVRVIRSGHEHRLEYEAYGTGIWFA
ncbi:hypothetical protein ACFWMT_33925 [Streptomyces sp. NPDC058368]|uniref:hypothetical protein n=1 Tax=Streptomyces sp. NPDC058368 TaxID=3346461 RepID=UPI00364DE176